MAKGKRIRGGPIAISGRVSEVGRALADKHASPNKKMVQSKPHLKGIMTPEEHRAWCEKNGYPVPQEEAAEPAPEQEKTNTKKEKAQATKKARDKNSKSRKKSKKKPKTKKKTAKTQSKWGRKKRNLAAVRPKSQRPDGGSST